MLFNVILNIIFVIDDIFNVFNFFVNGDKKKNRNKRKTTPSG